MALGEPVTVTIFSPGCMRPASTMAFTADPTVSLDRACSSTKCPSTPGRTVVLRRARTRLVMAKMGR